MAHAFTKSRFLNVDLELRAKLRAKRDLTALALAFEPKAYEISSAVLPRAHLAILELAWQPAAPEAGIRSFVRLVERLPPRARALWNATTRDFSIGVAAGSQASSFELALSPTVLKLAAGVGARIVFVVYVHDRNGRHAGRGKRAGGA